METTNKPSQGTPLENYERFSHLALQDEIIARRFITFGKICRMAGVPKNEIDIILRNEIGLSGRAFIRALKRGYRNKKEQSYCD